MLLWFACASGGEQERVDGGVGPHRANAASFRSGDAAARGVRFVGWGDSNRAQLDLLRTSLARVGLVEAAPRRSGSLPTKGRAVEDAAIVWAFEPEALPSPTDLPPQRLLNHIPGACIGLFHLSECSGGALWWAAGWQ